MYEERKEKFSFKSFFLTLLLVLLFVFLMLWLFPTRSYVDERLQSTHDLERLSVLYDEIFANNVGRMKDAAIGYFTNERLPKKIGESKKLTLQEMYDLHLVLKMKDKDGKPCNTTKSYVEMTKYEEEYRLKVNLSCGEQEDYIIVYLGCYNYCSDGICEKRVPEEESTPKEEPIIPENPLVKKYSYEYKLVVEDSTTCENWTDWSKDKVTPTDLIKVESKQVEELIGYKTIEVPVTKTEIVTKQVTESYISKYVTELVLVDTKEIWVGTTTQIVTEEVEVGTVEVPTGEIRTGTKIPENTGNKVYKKLSEDTPTSCSYCENETIYTWEIYEIKPVYEVREVEKEVDVYKTIDVFENKEVPVYDFRTVEKKEEVTTTTYEEKQIPEYGKVTYYRSQTCKINKGYTDIKWSENKLDTSLIGKGYKLTGNVKEI